MKFCVPIVLACLPVPLNSPVDIIVMEMAQRSADDVGTLHAHSASRQVRPHNRFGVAARLKPTFKRTGLTPRQLSDVDVFALYANQNATPINTAPDIAMSRASRRGASAA
jgi:hypothetical protein